MKTIAELIEEREKLRAQPFTAQNIGRVLREVARINRIIQLRQAGVQNGRRS